MLQFDIDVSAADQQTRTIEGVAVPYGETANLGGTVYRFQEGSLVQARNRTPLLLGHDRNRPIGVLVELADTPNGALARFQIDNGIEGDLAVAAKEMKPAPERLDRPEWKLAEPVVGEAGLARLREETDQALAKACAESIAQIDARFVDAKTGILPLLR